LRLAT